MRPSLRERETRQNPIVVGSPGRWKMMLNLEPDVDQAQVRSVLTQRAGEITPRVLPKRFEAVGVYGDPGV